MSAPTTLALSEFPWLALLLLLLPAGAAITLLQPARTARWSALTTAGLCLLLSLGITIGFNPSQPNFQYEFTASWIPSLNSHYLLGVDGISVLFLPFTALLFIVVILANWNAIRFLPQLFFALLLLLEGLLLGVFCALDTLLFMLCWELSLIPVYFLISLWGAGAQRRYAAGKYTLFMLFGGAPMLLGFVLLALQTPANPTFAYPELLANPIPAAQQTLIFFLLLTGVAVKIPLIPFHSWLPLIAQEGSASAITLLLSLKIGVYALLRFVIPLAPQATLTYQWLLVGMGMFAVLYGAVTAMSQSNLRGVLAFSGISHVGLVVLGISSLSLAGLQGAIFQLLNFTLFTSSLFILVGFLHQRSGTCELQSLGGLAGPMPRMAAFFLLFGLASMGIPLTSGFPAELLLLSSVFSRYTGAGLLTLFTLIIGASGFLIAYRKAFWGPLLHPGNQRFAELKPREYGLLTLLAILVIGLGCYPQLILSVTEGASNQWLRWSP